MMLIPTRGIVFKSFKFQESSLIVKIFTESHGIQTFMVKGIRSVKANGRAAMFQSGMLLDLIMYYQEQKSFKTLKEYKAAHVYTSAFYEIKKSSVLMFLMEILEQCITNDQEEETLFNFIFGSLQNFDRDAFSPDFHLYFLLEYLRFLGIFPRGKFSESTPYFNIKEGTFIDFKGNNPFVISREQSAAFSVYLGEEKVKANRETRKQVLDLIIQYFSFHIENFKGVKSLKVLETILA